MDVWFILRVLFIYVNVKPTQVFGDVAMGVMDVGFGVIWEFCRGVSQDFMNMSCNKKTTTLERTHFSSTR